MELIEEAVELPHDYVKKSNFRDPLDLGWYLTVQGETVSTFLTSMNIPDARVEVMKKNLTKNRYHWKYCAKNSRVAHKSQNLTGGMPMLEPRRKEGNLFHLSREKRR